MKILVIHKVYIDVNDDKFSSLCNLACLVWESQKKLETFANATGYEWLLHLIVWSSYLGWVTLNKIIIGDKKILFCLVA